MAEPDSVDELVDDHLCEGDVFSIYGLNGENVFKVAKVIKTRPDGVHIFVYDGDFSERPSSKKLVDYTFVPTDLDVGSARNMYYPVSRKLFSLMRPMYLGKRDVIDVELQGYRQWCLTGGETLGDSISLDDEVDNNWRVYWKIFATYSIPCFFASGIYMLAYGAHFWLLYAFVLSIGFGAVMVVLQWTGIRRQRKNTLRRLSTGSPRFFSAGEEPLTRVDAYRVQVKRVSVSSIQFREIELPLPFKEAFELGVRSISDIKNCKPVAIDLRGGTIEGRVKASMVEDGQEVLIVFSQKSTTRTTVIVWSESDIGVTVDMGKNLGNVNAIISYLKTSAEAKEPFSIDVGDNKARQPDRTDA